MPSEKIAAAESFTVICKRSPEPVELRFHLPRPVAPVTELAVDEQQATPQDVADEYRHRYPTTSIGEVRYIVRAVMDDGSSVKEHLARRCDEAVTLRVHVVNGSRDLTDSWIDSSEFGRSSGLYRSEAVEDSFACSDGSVLGLIAMGPHRTARLALLAGDAVLTTVRVQPTAKLVTFVVKRERIDQWLGTMQMRVVEAGTNRPIIGARVTLTLPGPSMRRRVPLRVTDHRGMVNVTQFPAYATARVNADGYLSRSAEVTVRGGGEVAEATVEMSPEVSVSGRVLDRAGQPVFAAVMAYEVTRGGAASRFGSCEDGAPVSGAVTDHETGAFEIGKLAPGRYELHLLAGDGTTGPDPNVPPLVVSTTYGSARHLVLTWYPDPNAPKLRSLGCRWGSP